MEYYVNDGIFGSFYELLFKKLDQPPSVATFNQRVGKLYSSTIWGPACNGVDKILDNVLLPELFDGDWITFKDMGAYSTALSSSFNGMPKPKSYYVAEFNGQINGWVEGNLQRISLTFTFKMDTVYVTS
ncbi:hypothetical protein EB796_000607 [Bugula neritina]|uniref:Orn/DAP/Arg decarboxylase 2 C-terminal domain-containing protein n=1 Tax=Bugula neritina TaxID=10212 RepID=A0A7J7KS87_BUGNE|nr:hypothetical protein EB796_000607 [Bugula neritina]